MPSYGHSGSSSDCPGDIIPNPDPKRCCHPCCDEEGQSESGVDLRTGHLANCD